MPQWHPNGIRWVCVACYLFIPLTGIGFLVGSRGDRERRFHARQSIALGLLYIGALFGLSLCDAVGGAWWRWIGAFVSVTQPVVGTFLALVWAGVIVQLVRGHGAHIPMIRRWAEK